VRTFRLYTALVVLAGLFGLLFAVLSGGVANAATLGAGDTAGRYPHAACLDPSSGATNADLTWVSHVTGCGTDVPAEVVMHLLTLRNAGCEGIRANVPASRIVDVFAAELGGNRTEAVTLFTATSVYCYGD
jgi:hypothetical protein